MISSIASITALIVAANALAVPGWGPHHWPGSGGYNSWNLKQLTSLVVFGDSYSDDSRLGYFIENNGSAPPVGWVDPVNYAAADGGRIWGEYVKQYTGANLYNYAVSGAVCSNDITPRFLAVINEDFPSMKEYEVPAFVADSQYVEPNGTKFLTIPADETVYAMWDGTNDLGYYAFIQDEMVKGSTNLTTYVDCIYEQLHRVYDNGGRYFVLFNIAPLELAPEYAAPPNDVGNNQYWLGKPKNHTLISYRMMEQVVTINSIFNYRTPFEVVIERNWPGASFAVFDVNGLMTDVINNPTQYLNGTAPPNVTGFVHHCNTTGGDCTTRHSPDSYVWYDELHPSEQTERVIAAEFVNVVKGSSSWATYWSS